MSENTNLLNGSLEPVHEQSYDVSPSVAVITAVAEATNRSATEMPPLAEWFDPDALDSLIVSAHDDASVPTVTFEYIGWQVAVTPNYLQIAPQNDG
ncbi:HalOD1 output domain-containing protein [Haloprofundus halobius]|uniref:HalOD1 output domain-containing protein n=1 Tax=Haloprofundus halobius TaxID=2876194 RepID=UPI001CC964E3|nr:HalOD1 output domain-containing protein [Haloprofundus halobius]